MKQYQSQKEKKAQQIQICAVKLSKFDLPLQPLIKSEISQNEKIMKRRQNVKTPFSTKREESFEQLNERYLRSSQQSRLSSFIEGQIHQLHQNNDRMAHFSQFARDKINQLKTIMNLKSLNMKKQRIKQEYGYHIKEYKLNKRQNGLIQEQLSLHSRNVKSSPFAKSMKARRYLSKSMQLKNPSVTYSNEYKSIEVGSQSKYGKIKKLVLLGGALNVNLSSYVNPENIQIQKRTGTGHSYYNRFIRQTKTSHLAQKILESENDFQPWQTYRGDSVFQPNTS